MSTSTDPAIGTRSGLSPKETPCNTASNASMSFRLDNPRKSSSLERASQRTTLSWRTRKNQEKKRSALALDEHHLIFSKPAVQRVRLTRSLRPETKFAPEGTLVDSHRKMLKFDANVRRSLRAKPRKYCNSVVLLWGTALWGAMRVNGH
jgi:hypothetical protein